VDVRGHVTTDGEEVDHGGGENCSGV
jgi:hypothetical protein